MLKFPVYVYCYLLLTCTAETRVKAVSLGSPSPQWFFVYPLTFLPSPYVLAFSVKIKYLPLLDLRVILPSPSVLAIFSCILFPLLYFFFISHHLTWRRFLLLYLPCLLFNLLIDPVSVIFC